MSNVKGTQVCVTLTREERLELQRRFDLPLEVQKQLALSSARPASIWMTRDEAEGLRERAGELFQEHGLGDNDAVSAEGHLLEGLIDKFFVG